MVFGLTMSLSLSYVTPCYWLGGLEEVGSRALYSQCIKRVTPKINEQNDQGALRPNVGRVWGAVE